MASHAAHETKTLVMILTVGADFSGPLTPHLLHYRSPTHKARRPPRITLPQGPSAYLLLGVLVPGAWMRGPRDPFSLSDGPHIANILPQ